MSEKISLQVSNLSLPYESVARGIGYHLNFLRDVHNTADRAGIVGYDGGYEITPTRALMTSIYAAEALGRLPYGQIYPMGAPKEKYPLGSIPKDEAADMSMQRLWSSSHASWATPGTIYSGPLVTRMGSLKSLERLDVLSGSFLPSVVFGDLRHKNGKPVTYGGHPLKKTGVQFAPEVKKDWGMTSAADYDAIPEAMRERGIKEIVGDAHHLLRAHLQEGNGTTVSTDEFCDVIKDNNIPVGRIHMSLGRLDVSNPTDQKRSVEDLRALIKGADTFRRRELGKLTARMYGIWMDQGGSRDGAQMPVVTETLVTSFGAIAGDDRHFDRLPLAAKHAVMVSRIREFFAGLR